MLHPRVQFCKSKLRLEVDEMITNTTATVQLVQRLKKEYESFIKVLEDASDMHSYLTRQVATVASEEYTHRNILNYKASLKEKLCLLQADNLRLTNEINEEKEAVVLINERQKAKIEAKKYEHMKGTGCTGFSQMKVCTILGMTPSQWADKACLRAKLEGIIREKQSMTNDLKYRFSTVKNYKMLLRNTLQKESECEALNLINNTLKLHVKRLKLAIEATKISAYHECPTRHVNRKSMGLIVQMVIDDFNEEEEEGDERLTKVQNESKNIMITVDEEDEDDLTLVDQYADRADEIQEGKKTKTPEPIEIDLPLKDKLDTIERPKSFEKTQSFNNDDPLKEQEAELTMDHVEHFSLLFTAGKFKEAAHHAIYSPRGILRTPHTLKCFKGVDANLKKKNGILKHSHLLYYCKLLISTVDLIGKQPSTWETNQCFKCAINQGELDLVEYWLAQQVVPVSEAIGFSLLESCKCEKRKCTCKNAMLASHIFTSLNSHHFVLDTMIHQGRYATALCYSIKTASLNALDLARLMVDKTTCDEFSKLMPNVPDLPIEEIIVNLVAVRHEEEALNLAFQWKNANKNLNFDHKRFIEWDHSVKMLEPFSNTCLQNGLENEAYAFIASGVLHDVIKKSIVAIRATTT